MEYNEENFKNANPFDLFEFTCDNCGKTFVRNRRYISKCSGKVPHYCSNKCRGEANRTLVKVHCAECGEEKYIQKHEYETSKNGNFFCCQSHAASFNNRKRKSESDETPKLPIRIDSKSSRSLGKEAHYLQ